jgi:hypothetical protein
MKESRGGTRIPDWIPADDRVRLDLSGLAHLDDELDQACRELGDRLGAHVAAYRPGATARPTGLCSLFRYAVLTEANARLLGDAESERHGIIFVAYARPLQRW